MWFRNLTLYRLPDFNLSAEELDQALAQQAYIPCTDLELSSQGWIPPRDGGSLVHSVNGQMLITLCIERKLLPAAVIKETTQARAAEIEEQQGYKPGRKQLREIKQAVTDELLPKAFSIRSKISAWIDPAKRVASYRCLQQCKGRYADWLPVQVRRQAGTGSPARQSGAGGRHDGMACH